MTIDVFGKLHLPTIIIGDLRVALMRENPEGGQSPFQWLEPGYSGDVWAPLVERLKAGYESLPSERQILVKDALESAVDRCMVQWLGAEVTLTLLDWIYVVAPEIFSSKIIVTMIFHKNPIDDKETGYWVGQFMSRLMDEWSRLNILFIKDAIKNKSIDSWRNLIISASIDRCVDVAYWIGLLLKDRPNLASEVANEMSRSLIGGYSSSSVGDVVRKEAISAFVDAAGLIEGYKNINKERQEEIYFLGNMVCGTGDFLGCLTGVGVSRDVIGGRYAH